MSAPSLESARLSEDGRALIILDQTLLPGEVKYLRLESAEEIYEAIRSLRVRGAPAIGVAAAIGAAVCAQRFETSDPEELRRSLRSLCGYLASARPTAVNLSWALARMEKAARINGDVGALKLALTDEAQRIRSEDIAVCRAIGEHGCELLKKPGCGILTHCNAGALATVRYGTALAPIYVALESGRDDLRVYCDETRPLLQGARLTARELVAAGVDTTLICDGMAASVMASGKIDVVLVGADRVARNGDAANKIGTLSAAIAARRFGIPFYVCAPVSTIDPETPDGAHIPIEERAPEEITELWYEKRMAPEGVKVFNPAFDVTPCDLITGIITERGIVRAPYAPAFARLGIL